MPSRDQRMRHVALKIKRAKEHITDLQAQVVAFLKTNPYRVATKRNPDTRQLIYYVESVETTPDCLPLLAGDAIQNLMSALDHLAYQLVCCDTADKPPNPEWIYFPIRDTAQDYEAKKKGKMQGALDETFKLIDALKPYKGGNDPLWILYRLNNIEKHRLLVTVGSMFQSLNLGAHVSATMADFFQFNPSSPFYGKEFPALDAFFKPAAVLFPLKVGDELFIDGADAKVNEKIQFRFNVAIYEPQIVGATSILETIHQLRDSVESAVSALAVRIPE
jgi:hypothetical protein